MLNLTDKGFKIATIDKLESLMEKVSNMHEKGEFQQRDGNLRKNQLEML